MQINSGTDMEDLTQKKCVACEGGIPALSKEIIEKKYLPQTKGWQVSEDYKKISKDYKFKNFMEAISFVNKVGEIAEEENHHPDITFGWGYCKIALYTHAVKGLTENDFILAAKINEIKT